MERAVLFRIRKDRINDWKDWCKEISTTLRNEAVISLEEERLVQETALCFQISGEWYGIGYMDGECLPANPNREINKRHKEMKRKCIEFISEAEILYNIKA